MTKDWSLACSTLAYAESSLDAALQGIAAGGFEHVEIAAIPGYCDHLVVAGESETNTATRVGRLLGASGLHLVSVSAHIDLVPAPPGHLPGYPADEALAMLLQRVRLARALGASVVNTMGAFPQSDEDHRLFVKQITKVADACDEAGIVLCLETANGLTANAQTILSLLDDLRGAPIWINFDTGNLAFYSGLDPLPELEPVHRYVRSVHLKDHRGPKGRYDFPAIGDGDLDLAGFISALARFEYVGPISAEIEFEHPVHRPGTAEVDRAVRNSRLAMSALVEGAA